MILFVGTKNAVFAVILILSLLGCHSRKNFKEAKVQTVNMKMGTLDAKIPSKIWHEIEQIYDYENRNNKHRPKKGESVPTEHFGFTLYLVEKTKNVLRGDYGLVFSRGGGQLDFSEYVRRNKRGSFYFGFKEDFDLQGSKLHVLYISGAKKRKIEGRDFGSGCGKFFEVTSFFEDAMSGSGILINTSDARHVSVLAGTYIFVASVEGTLYLSRLRISDSRNRAIQCGGSI